MASLRPLGDADAAAAATPTVSSSEIQGLKAEGNRLFKDGDFSAAAAAYSRCIDACKQAEKLGSEASSEFPSEATPYCEPVKSVLAAAYCNRSMCRLKQQDLRGAEADSRAALEIRPDYSKALYRQALALLQLGDLGASASAARRLLRIDPKNAEGARLLMKLNEAALQEQQQHVESRMPSTLLDTAVDATAAEKKRVKAFRDLGRLAQERESLHETLAKEGLLQRLAVFLKQQNVAANAASAADFAQVPAGTTPVVSNAPVPAVVEAAGWELLSSLVQYSPLGMPTTDGCTSSASSEEKVLFKVNEPLCIPPHIKACRTALRRIWTSEELLFTFRRLQRQGLLDPPADNFASVFAADGTIGSSNNKGIDPRRWRGLSAAFLLRVFGHSKQSESESFEHDASFLEAVSSALDCAEASTVQLAALQALSGAADARRRLGLKAKALALRHGVERCLEAALALLSAAVDKAECGGQAVELEAMERNIELTVVTLLRLLGDKERAEADGVDMQRLADQLLSPFLSCCHSKDPNKQAETYLRQKLLDDSGVDAILKLLRDETRPEALRAKLGVALARVCVHSKVVKEEVLERVNLFILLEELLQQLLQRQQQPGKNKKGMDDDLARCVLELFFFLSLHAEFKSKLVELANFPTGSKDLLRAVLDVGAQFCSNSGSLPRYLLCGGLCNLMKSSADKDRCRKQRGLHGGVDLDESQLEELEAFYDQLPAEAKPVPNGQIDLGDEASVCSLRQVLLERGACKLLVRACTAKPLPSPNVLLAAGSSFFLLAKNEKNRGLLVKEGALRALLTAIGALKTYPEDKRDLQQAAAQLCISVNPALFSYHDALDLVPVVLPLLSDSYELLQYEGALAITNLTSVNEELRQRAFSGDAWRLLGNLLFSENDLLRAAALEGWCNLAGSSKVQDFLGGKTAGKADVQDLRLLLAFCLETNNPRAQQAAAGALATLLNNSDIAKALPKYDNYQNLLKAFDEATEEQGPLLDRLVVSLYNIWGEEAQEEGEKAVKSRIEQAVEVHRHKLKGLSADLAVQMIPSGQPEGSRALTASIET
ncbi:TPR domain-containing protein [Cyclospora cayetanensis]|uniref:TPR domain-containing protein n=1 Tax=Cyclospora cayetanensis TaxID=88456 RepID=A0A1D3D058_9EIME|nr:TPR domain-containing protein [Cyclospora cayetanensis]